ncbi:hypothetical protein [uncultured Maricaulis sp.]|uniref:hypothetical protein n=1 Tax=uncultured Maricaulis sp. TaxID=174710 RepID=UPI0030D790A6|tara:strand:- start:48751 stop:48999 length:249 start_codon:yes stop_codon:yes gene_type:complete
MRFELMIAASAAALMLTACSDGADEHADGDMESAAEHMGAAMEDAADATGEAMHDAAHAAEDAMTPPADAPAEPEPAATDPQ